MYENIPISTYENGTKEQKKKIFYLHKINFFHHFLSFIFFLDLLLQQWTKYGSICVKIQVREN